MPPIRSVVRTSLHMGIECIGIRRGYHGLINGDFVPLTFESVSGLSRKGGTMLYSARSEDFKSQLGRERAVATCKLLGLDALVGIGGDGHVPRPADSGSAGPERDRHSRHH